MNAGICPAIDSSHAGRPVLRAGARYCRALVRIATSIERVLAYPLPTGLRWRPSIGLLIVLLAAIILHALAMLAQPLILYPDSADFLSRACVGLEGGKVWRGDYQFLPGFPYFLYWMSRLFPWPINTPLRLVQHGCLILSHLCAYGVVRTLSRSQVFAVVVGLAGMGNLGFLVLGNQLISEPLYCAAFSVAALLLCVYSRRPRVGLLYLAGLSIGAASLVRATGVYLTIFPILLVAATAWRSRRRPDWPRPRQQFLALAGCLGLITLCLAPVVYLNRTRMHYWGLTHYLGINLYARVIEYDGVFDAEAPAQRLILQLSEQKQLHHPEATPAWRTHWSCTHLVMEEGGFNQAEADNLLRQAALEGIRSDQVGYLRRTLANTVVLLAADYRFYTYDCPTAPPSKYPKDYSSDVQAPLYSPYHFNKASIGRPQAERCYRMLDCFEPFGGEVVGTCWQGLVERNDAQYFGIPWDRRIRLTAWATVAGALLSLFLRRRTGWWLLFGLVGLHVVGAAAVEWPLPRYRLPFDCFLAIYPWLCLTVPLQLLRRAVNRLTDHPSRITAPIPPSLPTAA